MNKKPDNVKPIQWAYFSPKVQAHGLCRYCSEQAVYMRKGTKGYIALCKKHSSVHRTGKGGTMIKWVAWIDAQLLEEIIKKRKEFCKTWPNCECILRGEEKDCIA